MEPPALMDKKIKKAETLPVYTDMKKHWIPNEDGVEDEQFKTAPTIAKIKEPKHMKLTGGKNTTHMTILPETVSNSSSSDPVPSAQSLT